MFLCLAALSRVSGGVLMYVWLPSVGSHAVFLCLAAFSRVSGDVLMFGCSHSGDVLMFGCLQQDLRQCSYVWLPSVGLRQCSYIWLPSVGSEAMFLCLAAVGIGGRECLHLGLVLVNPEVKSLPPESLCK